MAKLPRRLVKKLPEGCTHILTTRIDRPERLALYTAAGELAATFGFDDTPAGIATTLKTTLHAIEGESRTYGVTIAA